MTKRIIALLLSFGLMLSTMSSLVYANFQIPVDRVIINEVYYVEGQNVVTGEAIIRPTMTMSWVNPAQWGGDPATDTIHTPDFYEVIVDNLTTGTTSTVRINEGSTEFNEQLVRIHEEMNLATGSLYNILVRPFHYHLNTAGTAYVLAPESGAPQNAYTITDLDVDFITSEDSITVIWDNIGVPAFEYRIAYAIGDYSSRPKQDLLNNKEGDIVGLRSTSSGVKSFFDPVDNRNKLSYTITENIYPGQVYSVMVEPTVEIYNSKSVMRNRNYPYIRTTSTNVELDLFEEGDYVRLEWDIPGSFKVGQSRDEYALVQATLLEYVDGQSRNIVIFDGDSAIIGYYKVAKPSREVQYQIKFVYRAVDEQSKPPIEPESNLVTFVPSELSITPTRPPVPSLLSQAILSDLMASGLSDIEIRQVLRNKYFVPGDTYTGNLNNLLAQNITFNLLSDNSGINFVWGAFERIDVDPSSSTYNQYIYDLNVSYDIWVTESLTALNFAIPVIEDSTYGLGKPNNLIYEDGEIIGFSERISQYYNEETGRLETLEPNKVYYIKIVAKKSTANRELISEPNISTLYYGYDGDAFEPPTIVKPPLQVDDQYTTQSSITLIWQEHWFEALSPDAPLNSTLAVWRHQVWVQPDGTITDYYVAGAEYFEIYKGVSEAERLEDYLTSVGNPLSIITREVDLGTDDFGQSDVRYKFYRIPYAQVQSAIDAGGANYSFNNYYQDLITADKAGTNRINWIEISPNTIGINRDWLSYKEINLLPNTSYLFMVYPYRVLYTGEELLAHYPTPIIVSTEPEEIVVIPDPIVPNLYVSGSTDTMISVMWKYNKDFQYELMYSPYENVEQAIPVQWSLPESVFDPKYPVNGAYYQVDVKNLFPNSEYYFWIRAYQPVTNVRSHWSNSVLGRTRDVATPPLPKGLGIASKESMIQQGYSESVTDDYFALEWLLLPEDQELLDQGDTDSPIVKVYSYIIEIAENERFIDPIYIESTGGIADLSPESIEILAKNLVKVNELIQNRAYYIRLKTRVTVTGENESQKIVKDSIGYTPTIKIITVATDSEYDGVYDPALDILPEDDYELIYNKEDGTLVFRFRDNDDGDANVDQRLISELIEQNIYTYPIDISSFGKETINHRIIRIPYSIMNAFNKYKVGLKIDAGEVVIDLPYESIKTELELQAKQYGVQPMVEIRIDTLKDSEVVKPESGLSSVSSPQEMSIRVKSTKTNKDLNFTDKNLKIGLVTSSRFQLYNQSFKAYVYDYKNKWNKVDASFSSFDRTMSFETARLGIYGGYVVAGNETNVVTPTAKTHWSEPFRAAVFSLYDIDQLNPYDPNNKVSEQAMIHIVYGMVTSDTSIDVKAFIPNSTMDILSQSGIKTNGSKTGATITREEAIGMMVRAYEIKYDVVVSYFESDYNSFIKDTQVNNAYAKNLAKAVALGFVANSASLRPKEAITYGELFKVWAVAEDLL